MLFQAVCAARCVKFSWGSGRGGAVSPPVGPGQSHGGGPEGEAPGKSLGYFRSTNALYKALFVRKTRIIPFLISFLTLWREIVLAL